MRSFCRARVILTCAVLTGLAFGGSSVASARPRTNKAALDSLAVHGSRDLLFKCGPDRLEAGDMAFSCNAGAESGCRFSHSRHDGKGMVGSPDFACPQSNHCAGYNRVY